MTMEEMTSRICRMREPRTPAPTFMVALLPDLAAVSACSSCSMGCMSLQHSLSESSLITMAVTVQTFAPAWFSQLIGGSGRRDYRKLKYDVCSSLHSSLNMRGTARRARWHVSSSRGAAERGGWVDVAGAHPCSSASSSLSMMGLKAATHCTTSLTHDAARVQAMSETPFWPSSLGSCLNRSCTHTRHRLPLTQ